MSETRTIRLLTMAVLLVAVVGAFLIGLRINAEPDPSATGVVTQGKGTVTAKPDQLEFNVTVTNKAPTTAAAMTRTTNGVKSVIDALNASGVEEKDIQTTNISVEPSYNYSKDKETIDGYRSTSSLKVLVRALDDAGSVITAATTAAGNTVSVQNITMKIGNKDDLVAEAREQAVQNSKKAAEALAKAAGRDVDELVYVEEVNTEGDPVYPVDGNYDSASSSLGGRADVPIAAGEQKVDVTVKVRWSLQ